MGSENSKAAKAGSPENGANIGRHSSSSGDVNGTTRNMGLPPAAKVGNSVSCNENLLGAGLHQQTDASRSRSGSASSNTKQLKKPTMALKSRQLIQSCFQNPHENLGRRILKRTAEKRKDFGKFYVGLNGEQKDDVEETIKTLLKKSVANVEFMDEVQRMAEEFGERFVQYRTLSFKADYFSSIADATITECVFLDNAVHPAHLTLSAFSQFITTLFSSVRDGFYNEMKRLRRTSNSFSTGSNGSARREKKASIDSSPTSREATPSPRCGTPEAESSSHTSAGSSEDCALTPEQPIMDSQAVENNNNNEKVGTSPPKEPEEAKERDSSPGNGVSLVNNLIQEALQETVVEENAQENVQKTIIDSTCAPKEDTEKIIIDSTKAPVVG